MDKPQPIFKLNERVRLRDGVDPNFYLGYSRIGNEAWIRDRKVDNMGYPRVLIEWDKHHWSYNGAPDIWTWEPHFEKIEDTDMASDDAIKKAVENLVAAIKGGDVSPPIEPEEETPKDFSEKHDEDAEYAERIVEVTDLLQRSRAYVVIAIDEVNDDEPMTFPHIYSDAKDDVLELICQAQLTQVNAAFQNQLISERLQEISDERHPEVQ